MVEVDQLQSQLEMSNEKVSMIKDARAKDAKDAAKKQDELRRQNKALQVRITELEHQLTHEENLPLNSRQSQRKSNHQNEHNMSAEVNLNQYKHNINV